MRHLCQIVDFVPKSAHIDPRNIGDLSAISIFRKLQLSKFASKSDAMAIKTYLMHFAMRENLVMK